MTDEETQTVCVRVCFTRQTQYSVCLVKHPKAAGLALLPESGACSWRWCWPNAEEYCGPELARCSLSNHCRENQLCAHEALRTTAVVESHAIPKGEFYAIGGIVSTLRKLD